MAFSPDGTRLLTGSNDGTAKLWDAEKGQEVLTLVGHTDMVRSVAFSPDGTRLLTGSDDTTAKLWDARTGQVVLTLVGHTGWVLSVAFSPDGTRLLTGSNDTTAKLWDARTGQVVLTLKGHTGTVRSVAFSPDGTRLLTGSDDTTAKVWDARTGQEVLTLMGHTGTVARVAWSQDGKRVWSWDETENVRAWSATDGKPLPPRDPPVPPPSVADLSPDGRFSAKPDGTRVLVVDLLRPVPTENPWPLPDAAERKRYHGEKAAEAEKAKDWFAAAFHLRRLLRDRPDDTVRKRLAAAEANLKAAAKEQQPARMEYAK